MTIKLIALDLDGTTLNGENKLTERTKETLIKAARLGVEIVPVTGRCYRSLPAPLLEADRGRCIRYAIVSNGAEIREAQTGSIIYGNYIAPAGVREIQKALCGLDYMVEVYVKGSAYIERNAYEKIREGRVSYRNRDYVLETRTPVKGVKQLLGVHRNRIEKVAVYVERPEQRERVRQELAEARDIGLTSSGRNNIELIGETCGKATALQVLAERLQVSLSEAMAVGDGENDLDMLQACGISVAMDNAEPKVKACADFITAGNDRDGAAQAISRMVFGE